MKNRITGIRRALTMALALIVVLSMTLVAFAQTSYVVAINETGAVTHTEAVQAARDAATAARGTDRKAVVRFNNPGVISLKTLTDMNAAAGNVNVSIWGDTYRGNTGAVDVRVYINPAYAKGDVNLSGSTTSARAGETEALFEKYFDNNVAVVSLGQQAAFNHTINVAAKLDLRGMDSANLHFYAYDRATNSYQKIQPAHQYIDANGYLCFTTPYGGDIVVSDGTIDNYPWPNI